jgi:predicted lipoprotein
MSSQSFTAKKGRKQSNMGRIVASAAVLIVLAAMALDTKVVRIGSADDVRSAVFSAADYGKSEFPKVQADVEARAADAVTVATAIAKDRATAEKEYGVPAGVGPVISVKFTGVVGEAKSGIYKVAVEGVPDTLMIRVQTGPAINGTELARRHRQDHIWPVHQPDRISGRGFGAEQRDEEGSPGKGRHQPLTGKTISVVGAFKLVNPKNWLVTPVRLDVK